MILVFDLSGVFFNKGLTLSIERISKKYNMDPKKVRFVLNESFAEEYRTGQIDDNIFWQKAAKELNTNYIDDIKKIFFEAYQIQEETTELIKELKDRGIKVAYLSNSPKDRSVYLDKKYGFLSMFDFGMFSWEAHVRKPAREIYQKFLDKFNLNPEDILYIDDMGENLLIPKDLGMKTLLFVSGEKLIADLQELKIP